jgi:hypothetical protein
LRSLLIFLLFVALEPFLKGSSRSVFQLLLYAGGEEANAHQQSNAHGTGVPASIKRARASIFLEVVVVIEQESPYSYYTIL